MCGCVNGTSEPHVLCAPPCGSVVCPETLEVSEGTESENKVVTAFRQVGTWRNCRLPQ
jgi:hypothetical protein